MDGCHRRQKATTYLLFNNSLSYRYNYKTTQMEKTGALADEIEHGMEDMALREDVQQTTTITTAPAKPKRIRYKKFIPPPEPHILPELFSDDVMVSALCGEPHFYSNSLFLTCGLIVKARAAFQRCYRRSECKFPRVVDELKPQQFHTVILGFLDKKNEFLAEDCWNSSFSYSSVGIIPKVVDPFRPIEDCPDGFHRLWLIAEELTIKLINLSVPLQKVMTLHPLYPLHPETLHLQFHQSLLTEIKAYHDTVRRPDGTFSMERDEVLEKLCSLERMTCEHCLGKRQIYCGPCGGRRMQHADELLPPRVNMPFDILLLLHYQESLVKCTGIHTGALCAEGSVSYVNWLKPTEVWQEIIESLDPTRDVILFPYPNSTQAQDFPWNNCSYVAPEICKGDECNGQNISACVEVCNSSIPYNKSHRWRLVVLEASWGYAKTMAQQIIEHRAVKKLPPIPSVILTNVTGQYWRFQSEGHGAVSTIEAIAHTAHAAGLDDIKLKNLLVLFELQKYRVLNNSGKRGGRAPRAVEVEGVGIGDWKKVYCIVEM